MARIPAGKARWEWPQLLLASLAIVGVYVAMRFVSDLLDLPSGYATPVFIPAGVGFALTVTAGWRVLPAIALGAALLHLPGTWLGPNAARSPAIAITVITTVGSVLQAWLGASWFRRLVRPALDSARDVGRFLALTPAVCLINASISVSALYWLGLIPAADRWANWINWWAGDTIGVLLASPLVWIACGRPRALWRQRAPVVAVPLVLAAGAVVTVYEQAVSWETQQHLQPCLKLPGTSDGRVQLTAVLNSGALDVD